MSKPVRTENFVFMVFQVYIYIYIDPKLCIAGWFRKFNLMIHFLLNMLEAGGGGRVPGEFG